MPQDVPESTGATGMVIRRNLAHAGVEIQFPGKPDASVIARLKAAGFRWSFHSKVWYKKYGAYAWSQAHTIAGLELPSVKDEGQTDDLQTEQAAYGEQLQAAKKLFPGEARALDGHDMREEDRMAEQCGLTGGQD